MMDHEKLINKYKFIENDKKNIENDLIDLMEKKQDDFLQNFENKNFGKGVFVHLYWEALLELHARLTRDLGNNFINPLDKKEWGRKYIIALLKEAKYLTKKWDIK
jgi:hypothetical protein